MTDEQRAKFSHWNYRVTRSALPEGGHAYEIREVYYAENGEVTAWAEEPYRPFGESWQELADDVSRAAGCIGAPAFDLDTRADIPRGRRRRCTRCGGPVTVCRGLCPT